MFISRCDVPERQESLLLFLRCGCRKRRKHRRGPTKREVGHAIGRMRRFSSLPSVDPLTLCFTVPWVYLSNHALILGLVRDRLASLPVGSHVSSIQYVPRNVINGTRDLADRWLVTVTSERAKQELMLGLDWRGYKIGVRLYIDVLRIEYYNYLRFLELNNAMMTLKLPAPEAVPTS